MKNLRVAFVGFGKIGRIRFRVCEGLEQVELLGIYDPDPSVSADGVVRFESFEELLGQEGLDAVFISVPNRFTVPYATAALKRGIAVFAEKPPARTVDELKSLHSVYRSRGGPALMFGFNHRHKSGAKELMKHVQSGDLGKVLWIRGRYGKELEPSFFDDWRSQFEVSGGGILLDQGIHMVDLMREIAGGFDEVHSMISSKITALNGVEDNVFAIYRSSATGISASLHSTMTQWRYLFSLEVFLEHGSVVLNGLRTPSGNYGSESLTIHTRLAAGDKETRDLFFDSIDEDSWRQEILMFFEAVLSESPPPIGNFNHALATMELVEATYRGDPAFAEIRSRLLP